MSEVEGQQTPEAEGQVDVNQLLERVKTLEVTKERILDESKAYKSKYQEANSKLETFTQKQLEEQGNYEQLLEEERKRTAKLKADLESSRKNILLGNIKSTVAQKAKNAYDVEDLLRTPEAKNIQYDEDSMEVDSESVDTMLSALRDKKPYLFNGKKMAPQAAGSPANSGESVIKPKSLSKLSNEELDALILKS
jgi:hypothetical protein